MEKEQTHSNPEAGQALQLGENSPSDGAQHAPGQACAPAAELTSLAEITPEEPLSPC